MLAVDLGTTRIKIAHRDDRSEVPSAVLVDGQPWLMPLAHVSRHDGGITYGTAAVERSAIDPDGALDGSLIGHLLDVSSIRMVERSVAASDVLGGLIRHIRTRAPPCRRLVLALPYGSDATSEQSLHRAAQIAGFKADQVTFVHEAEAAALGSLKADAQAPEEVVLVDCGGRTVKWAWLRRHARGYGLMASPRPARLEETGGHAADLAMLDALCDDAESDAALAALDQGRSRMLTQIAALRENLSHLAVPYRFKLPGTPLQSSDLSSEKSSAGSSSILSSSASKNS